MIARILFVVVFLGSAVGHLTQTDTMAGYASSRGVPSAKAATLVSGTVLVVGQSRSSSDSGVTWAPCCWSSSWLRPAFTESPGLTLTAPLF